ncbi:MAG: lysophospholipid acyltransferase family protein [Candidatus Muiribacteriota bacterium]
MKYYFFRVSGFFIGLIPNCLLAFAGKVLGSLVFIFWKKRRKIGFDNLKNVYPEKTDKEINFILKLNFINFAYTLFEMFKQPYVKKNLDNIFTVKGIDKLEKFYRQNKGVILITAHFGNWELGGSLICALGYKLSVIQKKQKNSAFDKLINHYRKLNNIKPIGRKAALKEGVKALKKGEILGIISDQKTKTGGVFIDFFNQPALTTTLPAKLYLKFDSPIIFIYVKRKAFMKFEINFYDSYEEKNANTEEISKYINKSLESFIKETPHQWFWAHRRWEGVGS